MNLFSTNRSIAVMAVCLAATVLIRPVLAGEKDSYKGEGRNLITSVPRTMSYQGILKDSGGDPVADSTYSVTFRIFNVESGGTSLWDEAIPCATSAGVFYAVLGNVNLPFDEDYWLELEVGGEILDPRQKMHMVGYAAASDTADYAFASAEPGSNWTLADSILSTNDLWGLSRGNADNILYGPNAFSMVNFGIACTTGLSTEYNEYSTISGGRNNSAARNYSAIGGGEGNKIYHHYGTIAGGKNNSTIHEFATVGGGENNRAHWQHTTVGGGKDNLANDWYTVVAGGLADTANGQHNTISGGQMNFTDGLSSTIGGGNHNIANGDYTTVSGGRNNSIGSFTDGTIGGGRDNIVSGEIGTIAGGYGNSAGYYSSIGGGAHNTATGMSFVGGGEYNNANTEYATVAGGADNTATEYCTVGGGYHNDAHYDGCTISGGKYNTNIGFAGTISGGIHNYVSGNYAYLAGGYADSVSGDYAKIGGGLYNNTSGDFSIICGGDSNTATGNSSAIGGGGNNTSGNNYDAIFGGNYNVTSGGYSAICGGLFDTVAAVYGGVMSGYDNTAGDELIDTSAFVGGGFANIAKSKYSSICAGKENAASGNYSHVGGGLQNRADAVASVVSGGGINEINAPYSCIPGGINNYIDVGADVSLVFGYGNYISGAHTVSFFNEIEFGRLGLNRDDHSGGINNPIQVGTNIVNGNGAYLSPAGLWHSTSSKNKKENYIPFERKDLFSKIKNLEVESWQYIGSKERHIGPYAEEFNSAFGTGSYDLDGIFHNDAIAGNDVAGVALAGVKELIQENQELRDLISRLEKRITELENK